MALPVLTIFGATGATGAHMLKQALASKQYIVRAYARSPAKIPEECSSDPNFQVVQGDFSDTEKISEAVQGAKYVVAAVGNAKESTKGPYMVPFVEKLIAACEAARVEKLVYQAGSLSAAPGEKLPMPLKFMKATLARMIGIHAMVNENDKIIELLSASTLKFVATRPGLIQEKPSKGTLKASDTRGGTVTFTDLATFNLMVTESAEYDGKCPFPAY